jgi:hypothetical protein
MELIVSFFSLTYLSDLGLEGLFVGAAGGSVWVGRRFCHSGSILTLPVFSSYVMMPCVDRNLKNSVSLSVFTFVWFAKSFILCHCPSFMMAKSFWFVKGFLCSISDILHLKLAEHQVSL